MLKCGLPEPDPELTHYFKKYNELDLFKALFKRLKIIFGSHKNDQN